MIFLCQNSARLSGKEFSFLDSLAKFRVPFLSTRKINRLFSFRFTRQINNKQNDEHEISQISQSILSGLIFAIFGHFRETF